ncbi:hypothetical protein ACSTS3_10730 [Aquimarina muelleri]|uniref:hypothetical protein n=1 Tax=Aquimarina muelleri TaxID=279356 RepID=UPI003F689034
MVSEDFYPISGLLSKLLKKSLTMSELQNIANKYGVHYNTITNIRDRRKKTPSKDILKDMIEMAIQNQERSIKNSKVVLTKLQKQLEILINPK